MINEATTSENALARLVKSRANLMKGNIGMASMLLRLDFKRMDQAQCPTMATDSVRIYYCDEFVHETPIKELQGVLIHEACHVFMEHSFRRGNRDSNIWNIACDLAINAWLYYDLHIPLPKDGLFDRQYRGMTAEAIYRQLVGDEEALQSALEQIGGCPIPVGSGSDGEPQEGSGQGGGESLKPDDDESEDGSGSGSVSGSGSGDELDKDPDGTGGGNGEEDAEKSEKSDTGEYSSDPSGTEEADQSSSPQGSPDRDQPVAVGEVWDAQDANLNPLGESETKELKDAVRRTATLGATLAKAVARGGSFGDAIRKQISANEDADVDWVDLLRDFLKSTYPDDNSWSRLNPRHAWRGINLPSKVRSNKGGELLIAIDTSGSLSRTELKLFASEIEALCLDTGIDVLMVCYCDSTCHEVADGEWWDVFNISEGEEVNLRFLGGGGTNFTPPFLLYDDYPEEVEDAVAFIYFTDGYGEVEKYVNEGDVSDRNIEPNIPVLWALTHRDDYYNDKLPFGEKIYLTFNNY